MTKFDGIIFVFVFDLANEDSFNLIKDWLIIDDEYCIDYQRILVGNQFNPNNRVIEKERPKKLSEKNNMRYYETNTKDGKNVELIFKEIAEMVPLCETLSP